MNIKLDSWGFVFQSGVLDIYMQRGAIIGIIVIYATVKARQFQLARQHKNDSVKSTRSRKTEI